MRTFPFPLPLCFFPPKNCDAHINSCLKWAASSSFLSFPIPSRNLEIGERETLDFLSKWSWKGKVFFSLLRSKLALNVKICSLPRNIRKEIYRKAGHKLPSCRAGHKPPTSSAKANENIIIFKYLPIEVLSQISIKVFVNKTICLIPQGKWLKTDTPEKKCHINDIRLTILKDTNWIVKQGSTIQLETKEKLPRQTETLKHTIKTTKFYLCIICVASTKWRQISRWKQPTNESLYIIRKMKHYQKYINFPPFRLIARYYLYLIACVRNKRTHVYRDRFCRSSPALHDNNTTMDWHTHISCAILETKHYCSILLYTKKLLNSDPY